MLTLPTHVEGIDLRLEVPFEPSPSLKKRTESGNREKTLNRENVIRLCSNAKTTRRMQTLTAEVRLHTCRRWELNVHRAF